MCILHTHTHTRARTHTHTHDLRPPQTHTSTQKHAHYIRPLTWGKFAELCVCVYTHIHTHTHYIRPLTSGNCADCAQEHTVESFGEDMSCPVCHALLVTYIHHSHTHTVLLTRTHSQICFHIRGACARSYTHIQNIFMHTNSHVCVYAMNVSVRNLAKTHTNTHTHTHTHTHTQTHTQTMYMHTNLYDCLRP